MTNPSFIVGAGLAGLLAAHAWPSVPILEAQTEPRQDHRALLRFRSDEVARLTGIPFRSVLVRKGIWANGSFQPPSIALANAYALKVTGQYLSERSIWTVGVQPQQRFVAPPDFYERLLEAVGKRISWGVDAYADDFATHGPLITTAPLPVTMQAAGLPSIDLHRVAIKVFRFRIPGADLFQTVYFPDPDMSVYRASMTGDILIVESMMHRDENLFYEWQCIDEAFGFNGIMPRSDLIDTTEQKYGKIIPLDDDVRKSIMFKLTADHGIYSLGRFATWRNILLDDVVSDIAVIKRLMSTDDTKYDLAKARAT